MSRQRAIVGWLAVGALGLVLFCWAFPRVFPFAPMGWKTSAVDAKRIALERVRDLGEPVPNPLVEITQGGSNLVEWRLQQQLDRGAAWTPGMARAAREVVHWRVRLFAPGAKSNEWTYTVLIAPSGQVLDLLLRVPPEQGSGVVDPVEARERAEALLRAEGYDLADYAEPEMRSEDRPARTDRSFLFRDRSSPLGENVPYGLAVRFAGDRLAGFETWMEDPERESFGSSLQGAVLSSILWRFFPMILVPIVLFFFIRRYHEGEIGVQRMTQIFSLLAVLGLMFLLPTMHSWSASNEFGGVVTRAQNSWIVLLVVILTYALPVAALGGITWALGEVQCRDRWPHRLVSFDALFKRDWANATVAWDSLRGVMGGLVLAGAGLAAVLLTKAAGAWAPASFSGNSFYAASNWIGVSYLAFSIFNAFYAELFGRLVLVSGAERRWGWPGIALAVVAAATLLFPPFALVPTKWGWLIALLFTAVLTFLFRRYGLLTSMLAGLIGGALLDLYPLLRAESSWLQAQAWGALIVLALPLLLSVRHLTSGKELAYRYDDVPPHVRRIAERERQRVELETARGIQSSILPDLPPQLNGVEIAHSYLPASEVGGDFYDVLALEDGRLSVAVGDVAGHGVSSGLVMSMARSALAVQVTFNPEVDAVFQTLNRVVYQSARKRLLATLCYALLDPKRRELRYASAGHLYPYLVSSQGKVRPLEYTSYPLGVRDAMSIEARLARLDPGDTLFLLSDGLVEARPEGSEDLFGFERLEQSLARNAHLGVSRLRDAVLEDVRKHTSGAPREDDQTILVLRLP